MDNIYNETEHFNFLLNVDNFYCYAKTFGGSVSADEGVEADIFYNSGESFIFKRMRRKCIEGCRFETELVIKREISKEKFKSLELFFEKVKVKDIENQKKAICISIFDIWIGWKNKSFNEENWIYICGEAHNDDEYNRRHYELYKYILDNYK